MPHVSPKRLLLIASYNRSIVLFRKDLLLEFKNKGYEVLAVAHNDSPEVAAVLASADINYQPIKLSRTGFNPFKDLMFLFRLIGIMNRYKPSLIIAYTVKPVIYGSIAAKFFNASKIYPLITGLGYLETEGGGGLKKIVRKVMLVLYRFSLRNVNGVIFQNKDDQDYFYTRNLIKKNIPSQVVNGSGVNLKQFDQAPEITSPVKFILISRLINAKGVALFLEAAALIKKKYKDVEFHLVGQLDENNPDSISPDLLHSATEAGIINFHGFQNDVRTLLGQSSVFVLPSWYREGVPRTILEAMAMGKPIITTDNTGCRETVENGVNGFLIEKKNLMALVQAMDRFIEEPELVERMGKASMTMARNKFDVTSVNKAMLTFMNVR